jgi:hypothetical protein
MWGHRPLRMVLHPPVGKRRKTLDDGDTPGLTKTFSESLSGQVALRREQRVRLERSHRRKDQATCWKVRCHKQRPRKGRNGDTLFGTNSLKEEAI